MGRLRLIHLLSLDELHAAAAAWDELWWRSEATIPTLRAELVAQWVRQFAPRAEFHALVVEDGGQWVAGLPLVARRLGRIVDAGIMPLNEWSSRGELLLDPAAEADRVMDALVAATAELPWQLLWLDEVALEASRFAALQRAIVRAGMAADGHQRFQVGWIEIGQDWEAYRRRWSRKHRQQMSRHRRRLQAEGGLRFRTLRQLAPEQVEAWMRRGFEIEDRSWKGEAGTSVLRAAGMFGFFVRQARQLADWGQLQLSFLEAGGRPVAFAYGMHAKGVYHSCKGGYDPRYATHSPGQLLRYHMLEAFHAQPECRAMDCLGPITEAHRQWKPATYAVGRLVVAPRGRLGRMILQAYKHFWPQVRRLRGTPGSDRPADNQRTGSSGSREPATATQVGCPRGSLPAAATRP